MLSQPSAKMGGMSDDPRRRLGRGVIVDAGDPVPEGWDGAERVPIDEAVLAAPGDVVARLHRAWTAREPVVVDLGVDVGALRTPEVEDRPPHALTPTFEFARERLYFLARANNYDARDGRLVWGPALEATRLRRDARAVRSTSCCPTARPRGSTAVRASASCPVSTARSCTGCGSSTAQLTPDVDVADRRRPRARSARGRRARRGGPARIIAPAGSGKTRVLTERFRLLVARRGWGPAPVVRGRVQRARQGRDGAAARRCRARRAAQDPHAARARLRHRAARRATSATCSTEWDVRRRIEPLVPVRPRANTDVYAPYLEALGEVRLGLVAPARGRGAARRRRRVRGDVRRSTATSCTPTR